MVAENVLKLVGATSRESFLVYVQSELIVTVGRSERSMVPDTLSCLDFQFSSPYRDTTVITTHSTTVFLLILCTYIVVISRLFVAFFSLFTVPPATCFQHACCNCKEIFCFFVNLFLLSYQTLCFLPCNSIIAWHGILS